MIIHEPNEIKVGTTMAQQTLKGLSSVHSEGFSVLCDVVLLHLAIMRVGSFC